MNLEYLRSFRLGEYAIFDFVISFIGIYFISPFLTNFFLKLKIYIPRISWMYFTLPIGFLFHLVFRVNTQMTMDLLDLNGHYLIKIIMVTLFIFGLKNIKRIK